MSLSFSANSVRSFVRQFERPGAMRGEQVRLKDALDRPQAHARRLASIRPVQWVTVQRVVDLALGPPREGPWTALGDLRSSE